MEASGKKSRANYCHAIIQASGLIKRISAVCLHQSGVNIRLSAWYTGLQLGTVKKWILRSQSQSDIFDKERSGRPAQFDPAVFFKTIAFYCQPALFQQDAEIKLSLRWAAHYLSSHHEILGCSISYSSIRRILQSHSLKPHLYDYFLQITDPDFFPKMERIIRLYLSPLIYLFCLDECTGLQALQRYYPSLPPKEKKPGYKEFDYIRHGTTSLIAILRKNTGEIFAGCTKDHKTPSLVKVFKEHVKQFPQDATLHYILDNYSTHSHQLLCQEVAQLCNIDYDSLKLKTAKQRREWLQREDKRIVFHFLPFHGSWLNLIEIWFGIMQQKCLKDGSFTSVDELNKTIERFIQLWNTYYSHPFDWNYKGLELHQKVVRRFSKLLLIQSKQMDQKFLKKQLLLMNNLIEDYFDKVKYKDWKYLLELWVEKNQYLQNIIDNEQDLQKIFCQVGKKLAIKIFSERI